MLQVRRPTTDQCADIVGVRQQDGIFTALVRDESGREATGNDASQSLAVIHAAMKLFQPDVEPGKRTEPYAVETEHRAWWFYVPEEEMPAPPQPSNDPGIWCRMPYQTADDLRASLKFVPRPKKDTPEEGIKAESDSRDS